MKKCLLLAIFLIFICQHVSAYDDTPGIYPDANCIWSYPTDASVYEIKISQNDQYIAASTVDNKVYLFDSEGSLLWEHQINSGYTTSSNHPHISLSSDGSLIAVGFGKVHLYNANGILLWSKNPGKSFIHNVAISPDGTRIFCNNYQDLYCFDNLGTLLWQKATSSDLWIWETLVTSDNGEYIAMLEEFGENGVFYYNAQGTLLWKYKPPDIWLKSIKVYNPVRLDDVAISSDGSSIIVASSEDHLIYSLNRKGGLVWSENLESPSIYIDVSRLEDFDISSDGNYIAAIAEHILFLYSDNGNTIFCKNVYGGDNVKISYDGSTIIYDGRTTSIYGAKTGVYAIDNTGQNLWHYDTGNAVADYEIASDNLFTVIGTKSGKSTDTIYVVSNGGDFISQINVGFIKSEPLIFGAVFLLIIGIIGFASYSKIQGKKRD